MFCAEVVVPQRVWCAKQLIVPKHVVTHRVEPSRMYQTFFSVSAHTGACCQYVQCPLCGQRDDLGVPRAEALGLPGLQPFTRRVM